MSTVEMPGKASDFYVRVPEDFCTNYDQALGCGAKRERHPLNMGGGTHEYRGGAYKHIPVSHARYEDGRWVELPPEEKPKPPRGTDRPYADPTKPGRIDEDGVEWWACDPYPRWYRWEKGELLTRARW